MASCGTFVVVRPLLHNAGRRRPTLPPLGPRSLWACRAKHRQPRRMQGHPVGRHPAGCSQPFSAEGPAEQDLPIPSQTASDGSSCAVLSGSSELQKTRSLPAGCPEVSTSACHGCRGSSALGRSLSCARSTSLADISEAISGLLPVSCLWVGRCGKDFPCGEVKKCTALQSLGLAVRLAEISAAGQSLRKPSIQVHSIEMG